MARHSGGKHRRGGPNRSTLFIRALVVLAFWATVALVLLGLLGTTRHYDGPSLGGLIIGTTTPDSATA